MPSKPGARVRVAVTSRDGVTVNERLHRAGDVLVFDSDGRDVRFVDRRLRPRERAGLHRDIPSLRALLLDCRYLVSLGFTGAARQALAGTTLALIETREPVEEVVLRLARDDAAGRDGPAAPAPLEGEPR